MKNRREFIGSGVLLGGSLALGAAGQASAAPAGSAEAAAADDALADRFGWVGPEDDPVFGPIITGQPLGAQSVATGPSRHEEISKAFKLLWDAPRTDDPMELARYFEALAALNTNATNAAGDVARYNEEWAERSNPLISAFFGMTNTRPSEGDQTFWCAAFVSFVLYATGKASMLSALSGAYRRYSTVTASPEPGDIAVFRASGTRGDEGFGHVGFFVSQTDDKVTVLGGNQKGTGGSTGAVIESVYSKHGAKLSLHSYRKVKASEFV